MLSIITVAKGRRDIFQRSVESIWENCHDKDNIEHLVATDHDDEELNQFMKEYMETYSECRISHDKIQTEHYEHRNIHRDYWNPIALQSSGEIVLGIGNDTIMQTKDFDKIMCDALQYHKIKSRHSFFQILIDDDSENILPESAKPFAFCAWITLTRGAVNIFGGIAPGEIIFSSADQYVGQVFAHSLLPSQIDLREQIKTENISHYTGKQDTADDVTLSKPRIGTNWRAVADRQYDLALDYAMIKQIKWVNERMKQEEALVDNPADFDTEQTLLNLVNTSSDGRGLFDYGATDIPIPS